MLGVRLRIRCDIFWIELRLSTNVSSDLFSAPLPLLELLHGDGIKTLDYTEAPRLAKEILEVLHTHARPVPKSIIT